MKELFKNAYRNFKVVAVRLSFLLSIVFSTMIYSILNNYRGRVYHIQTPIDQAIPFNKFFVVPYVIWYIYVGFCFFYYAVYDGKKFWKILLSINIGMLICYVVYYFFPTYVPRPQVFGDDIFANAVRFIYNRDNPYNCFPSIHVLDSIIIAIYFNRDERFGYNFKLFSTFTAIMITFSTMFIKQHYLYDAISSIVISYGLYFAFNYKEVLYKAYEGISSIADINEE